jgi:PII-like signaling protein
MSNTEQLTIYVAEGDRVQGKLLYRALMDAARQSSIAGMTVARAAVGYGQHHRYISVDWIPELAMQMIVVLTAIDRPEAIARYIPHVHNLVRDGLAFTERVTVVHHAPVADDQSDSPLHFADPLFDVEDTMTDYERLTIYVGEADQWRGKPVHLALVEEARRQGLIGATVLRGMTGYGKHNQERIKFLGIIELSSDLPMMVSVIDRTEKIEQFLPLVQEMVVGGIVVRDPVRVVHHAPVNTSN